MKYRVGRDGREIGSWTLEELIALHQRGELLASDFTWCPGMPEWKPLAEILPSNPPSANSPALPDLPSLPDITPVPDVAANNQPSPEAAPQAPLPLRPQQTESSFQRQYAEPAHAPGAGTSVSRPAKPNNYLVWSVLVTFFCCQILGIVAIIFAAQVDSKYTAGDYAGAAKASRQAKTWTWVAAGGGVLVYLVAFGAVFFSAMLEAGRF